MSTATPRGFGDIDPFAKIPKSKRTGWPRWRIAIMLVLLFSAIPRVAATWGPDAEPAPSPTVTMHGDPDPPSVSGSDAYLAQVHQLGYPESIDTKSLEAGYTICRALAVNRDVEIVAREFEARITVGTIGEIRDVVQAANDYLCPVN